MTITGNVGDEARAARASARWAHRGSIFFLALGGILVGVWLFWTLYSGWFQRSREHEFERALAAVGANETTDHAPVLPPAPGEVVGRLEAPSLGLSVVVLEGVDDASLRVAVGHVPDTGLPGEKKNVGLAGHRDSFFRRVGELKPEDEVRISTLHGTFTYRVEWIKIVNPDETWVLDDFGAPALTLITCYPFHYIGAAPLRYVIRARLDASS